ncbi:aspartate dehydrogenase (plasmid) [Novosphingobium resinovorum]|uniref:aspartate dehydrogenase n=1 Tax=Novosphingobium TaxID=165696 RepID=UPI001B3C8F99|nr:MULTISPECIES: aspartate dehydrogenase [Novosphingobium]MBF7015167.1 aspartate dehydrogenase [Novosphingobium sp. HR1a]WJM29847.1 aspartate dehydrogenase [Novosphingobium resinovorum]
MASIAPPRIGLIGDGGISRAVREALGGAVPIVGILARCPREGLDEALRVETVADLLARAPDIIVECAGHEAVRAYGADVLRAGLSLMIVSTGALADPALAEALSAAAEEGGVQLVLASGAMAGIEGLSAARLGGLERVRYTGRKPALAWRGTPAEGLLDLAALIEPAVFFRGDARQAALTYPKNSNVAATVALAGIGFDRTEVELVADPTIATNVHELSFEGADGSFEVRIAGAPSAANPKTSALTAHSIVRLLHGMAAPIVI